MFEQTSAALGLLPCSNLQALRTVRRSAAVFGQTVAGVSPQPHTVPRLHTVLLSGRDSEQCIAAMNQSLSLLQNPATTICNILQKNYDEHIDNGGENAKRKRGDSGHGAALMSLPADSGRQRTLSPTGRQQIRVGPRFYLRFLELCNKMKVKGRSDQGDEWG